MPRYLTAGLSIAAAAATLALAACSPPTSSTNMAETIASCAACHGEDGKPIDPTFPVIWGQNRAYLLNQLHFFKTGHRKNDIMAATVEPLTKTDMEALATHFSQQPWPAISHPADSASEATAVSIVDTKQCTACHHEKFQGDTSRPRLAGQNPEYLLKTMQEFRGHERGTSLAMSSLLRDDSDDSLKALATYLASQPAVVANK